MHTDAERKYAAKAAVSGTRVGKMELLYSIAQIDTEEVCR